MIIIKTKDEIEKMRRSGQVVAEVLKLLEATARPGITTAALNATAVEECKKRNAIPLFLNQPHPRGGKPFQGAICASVNEEVVHGIPGNRVLHEGDIISIDFGVMLDGYAGDAAITVAIGEIDPKLKKLIQITEEALLKGIEQAKAGNRLGYVSNAIQTHAENHGFSVVRDFVGHGIGKSMWEDPPVPNYGRKNNGPILKEGMTLAIEPMLNQGTHQVSTLEDEWTVVTKDGLPSAHFEHSIVILDKGPEILTLR
ncbi:Peptidase M24, methionine aminopeptidase [Syntrophomonas zehnderi OL-4]|uniref:Methionine aminopeptidase n=1 Tax=Syntrophomonas zehnderi OL-4 TaxID=690567 RepID=A0A0E4C8C8_9FIRM|nr:type I methionyl aminopeptidase [Syntrophomonas zehnderi]CFX05133.1 Peptidase M24, methionine aminopeptidase [Syntrophomonas zehnderi OL-4]CFX35176.1 Peptidase M24, methionine aminopeptidase [Syntrophomonas zehnderi OL-4]